MQTDEVRRGLSSCLRLIRDLPQQGEQLRELPTARTCAGACEAWHARYDLIRHGPQGMAAKIRHDPGDQAWPATLCWVAWKGMARK